MPVRSRGSLLAGTVIRIGLLWAVAGCHSNLPDHDSFSMSNGGGNAVNGASSAVAPMMGGVVASSPSVRFVPSSSSYLSAHSPDLQPVPAVRTTARNPAIIASSWEPVQRVSAEQPLIGPDLNEAAPPARMPAGDKSASNELLPKPRPLNAANQTPQTPPAAMAYAGPMPPHPHADNIPREFDKMALPPYVVEPPDLLLIQASNRITLSLQSIEGQHLVGPDGTVNLGIYGKVFVAGKTLEQVADAVAARLLEIMPGLASKEVERDPETGKPEKDSHGNEIKIKWRDRFSTLAMIKKEMQVDVLSYNSKYYYVITDGGGYGQQVYPFLVTGNETVLDALAKVNGIPAVGSKKKIWVARATRPGQPPKVLPVDWRSVSECGTSGTNYQIFPGDRVFVQSDGWIRADTWLAKRLSPILRGFGAVLLGSATVHSVQGSNSGLGGLGALAGFR